MTTISTGKLNRRISLQALVDTPDGAGGVVRRWQTLCSTWAQITPGGGSEPYFASQNYPKKNYTVKLRYRPGLVVTPAMRLLYGPRVFNVRAVTDTDEAHVELVLTVEELQTQGATPDILVAQPPKETGGG